jgi:hypothetical protein
VLPPETVADNLATVNHRVSQCDPTVGDACIVAWRFRKGGVHGGGGGHQVFSGRTRARDVPALPSISQGMDIRALIETMKPFWTPVEREGHMDLPDIDADAVNVELAKLPRKSDEKLR